MDDVENVHNLSSFFQTPDRYTLTILPDPVYFPFENGKRFYKGEALILTVW